ncbi:MAG TPA: hypothetical protein VJV77_06580 [Casimicrobiaceae bacterium]|nr:hypothetical protein [Casimicrobiaceae bacterium]
MTSLRRRVLAGFSLPIGAAMLIGVIGIARAADPPATRVAPASEVHGSLDAFAAQGVALAWGVLRGKDEATTQVVVRVEADRARYGALAVAGVDPFTRASQALLAVAPIDGVRIVRIPRARFADLPRTEWRFFASATPAAGDTPALLVFYQGIPDTTPEFDDAARLEHDLVARIARARREAGKGS